MNFIPSPRTNQIFYGDLFVINGSGCLVFGSGKSKACRVAGEEFSLDFACLTREDDTLYGHFEMELRLDSLPDPVNDRKKINYFIRMLDERETTKITPGLNGQIGRVDYYSFLKYSQFNITFSPGSNQTSEQRIKKFIELTEGCNINEFLVVPWMTTHYDKGNLIKSYIK